MADVMERGGNLRNNEVFMQVERHRMGSKWVRLRTGIEDIIVQSDVGTPDINIMFQAPGGRL